MVPREIGMCVRPGAIDKEDEPSAASAYYRPFLYGTPSRMGMMGRGFGIGGGGRRGWAFRWFKKLDFLKLMH